jgi:hypothetical protein
MLVYYINQSEVNMIIIRSSKKLIYQGSSFCSTTSGSTGEHIYLFAENENEEFSNKALVACNNPVDYIKIEKR